MRKLLVSLALFSAISAYADTIPSPVRFGPGAPIESVPDLTGPSLDGWYEVPLFTQSIGLLGDNDGTFVSKTIAFTLDIDPGWHIDLGPYIDYIDAGTTQSHYDAGDWSYEFEQEIILCPPTATAPCTSGTSTGITHQGPSPLPPLTLTGVAEPGTGIYEYAEYARNSGFGSNGPPGFLLFLQAPAATPEPSTFALFGTGIIGLLGIAKRRFVSKS